MPPGNRFRHQTYTATSPVSAYRLLQPPPQPEVGSEEFDRRMRVVGDVYRAAGVRVVYLVHGTFVGHDPSGLLAELSRWLPSAGDTLRRLNKKLVDTVVGEFGNYTPQYAELFEQAVNHENAEPISVRLFRWSSENHHIGRADGAVRLLDELMRLEQPGRVLLWGHSHAGNVFALLTNLLGGDEETITAFFRAASAFYRRRWFGRYGIPVWMRVKQWLLEGKNPALDQPLDFVTFGTPIRYGWDSNGYDHLLHLINHHPAEGLAEHLARFPPSLENVLEAADGDYVQQIGIAGTNVMPGLLTWRPWWADRRLNKLLQPDLLVTQLQQRLQLGMRVPEEGSTLLVDYGSPEGNITQHHAGHAVYTHPNWLLFHAEQIAECFYGM